jgi:hypothetical protein
MRRVVFVVSLVLAGCGSCGAKREAAATAVPDVHVTIERPGKPPFVLDGEVLAKRPADLGDPPWLAWKLMNVVPEWDDSARVDVIDSEGFRAPLGRGGETLLLVGLGGESRVIRLEPGKPITAHRGEARRDAGRIRHVTKLLFVAGDAGVDRPEVSLRVVIRGVPTTWTRADLAKVEPIVLVSKDGDGERDAWPLRALSQTLVGDHAMPSEAIGEEPASLRIDPAKWKDATLEPVIRSNRRGRLKLVWLDAKTHEEDHDEPQQKGVHELRFP